MDEVKVLTEGGQGSGRAVKVALGCDLVWNVCFLFWSPTRTLNSPLRGGSAKRGRRWVYIDCDCWLLVTNGITLIFLTFPFPEAFENELHIVDETRAVKSVQVCWNVVKSAAEKNCLLLPHFHHAFTGWRISSKSPSTGSATAPARNNYHALVD